MLTPEIMADVLNPTPRQFCGAKVTQALKAYCSPSVRAFIESGSNAPGKTLKSKTTGLIKLTFIFGFSCPGSKRKYHNEMLQKKLFTCSFDHVLSKLK
jgi:hypothetical protein